MPVIQQIFAKHIDNKEMENGGYKILLEVLADDSLSSKTSLNANVVRDSILVKGKAIPH